MKIRHAFLAAIGSIALQMGGASMASADTVLLDQSGFVTGQQSFSQSFDLSSSGTLTVTLENIAWPQQLTTLKLLLSTAEGSVAPVMESGTESFNVSGGTIFAQWFGTADQKSGLGLGMYGLKIEWTPTAVPLPASLILLLSGLALLVWQRRNRPGVGSSPPVAAMG